MSTPRLAVLGWSDRTELLLQHLHALGGFAVAGVGDRSAASLLRARRATNAPCFQHTAEMLRRLDYDALLVADPQAGAEHAPTAAARGATLIAEADALPAEALDTLAIAAVRHGVPLALVRPLLREPAVEALIALSEERAGDRRDLAQIEMHGPRTVEQQLRDAVALAIRLLPGPPRQVTAAEAPAAHHLAAQLRYEDGALVCIGITAEATEAASLSVRSDATVASALIGDDMPASLRVGGPEGPPAVRQFAREDASAREAARILATLAGDPTDLQHAHDEAAVLGALESALATGQTHHVAAPGVRSTLRVLAGGAHGVSAPSGELRLLEHEAAS